MHRFYWLLLFCALLAPTLGQDRPTLLLQRGHETSEKVLAVGTIPGKQQIVTVGSDGTVKLWSAEGQVKATYYDRQKYSSPGEATEFTTACVAPDGSWAVGLENSGQAVRFSLPDGAVTARFPIPPKCQALATDGRFLWGLNEHSLFKWDLTGKELARSKTVVSDSSAYGYSDYSVGREFVAVFSESRIVLLDVESLEERNERPLNSTFHGLAFSPDGQKLAVSTSSSAGLLSVPALEVESLVDAPWGRTVSRLVPFWNGGQVYFHPVNGNQSDNLYRVDFTSQSAEKLSGENYLALSSPVVFQDSLLLPQARASTAILSLANGEMIGALAGDDSSFTAFGVDPASGDMITSTDEGLVRWSRQTGRINLEYSPVKMDYINALAFSPDATRVAAGDFSGDTVAVWDTASGQLLGRWLAPTKYSGYGHGVRCLRFIDSQRLLVGTTKGLTLYDVNTTKAISQWPIPAQLVELNRSNTKALVAAGANVWEIDLSDPRLTLPLSLRTPSVHDWASKVCYSWDGTKAYVGTYHGLLFACDLSASNSSFQYLTKLHNSDTTGYLEDTAALLGTERGLQAMTRRGLYLQLDPKGQVLSKQTLEDENIYQPIFAGDTVIYRSTHGVLNFSSLSTGKLLGSLTGVRDNRGWVAMLRTGQFDGNDLGIQSVYFELGKEVYGVDQFLNEYLRPGVVGRLLPGQDKTSATPRSVPELTTATLKKPPLVEIVEPRAGALVEQDTMKVKVKVTAQGHGAAGVALYHNGHRLPDSMRQKLSDTEYLFTVRAVQGANEIRATAFDSSLSVESRQDRVRLNAPQLAARSPKLHLLAVGVDKYDSGLSLRFAKDDASSVKSLFQSDLYDAGVRTMLSNEEATQAGIQSALASIAQAAEPQDAFVFYLAGHGTVIGEEYYFLPTDAKIESDATLQSSALSSQTLAEALRSVPATKQLMILDSCRSGTAVGVVSRYFAARSGLEEIRSQQLLARSSGTFLIAATKGEEYAYEIPELGHGVLTYALLDAMGVLQNSSKAAAANGVTVNDLLRAVSTAVPSLSQKYHGVRQEVIQYSSGQDFPLAK